MKRIVQKSILVALLALMPCVYMSTARAQVMQSSSYSIQSDSVNVGGGLSSSETYVLDATTGEVGTGEGDSATYGVNAGYWQMQDITLSVDVPLEETPGITSGSAPVRVTTLEIIPGITHAYLYWRTTVPVRSILRWGETAEYESGTSIANSFSTEHIVVIDGLNQNTEYQFSIVGETLVGQTIELAASSFATFPFPDVAPPANVSNITATKDRDDVVLSWQNPRDIDFESVSVLHSNSFFPSNPEDGTIIYEGRGETTRDEGRAIPGTTQYYTLFSYDSNGNISSGATVALQIDEKEITIIDLTDLPVVPGEERIFIDPDDLVFIQEGRAVTMEDGVIEVDGSKQFSISLPYEAVPEELKTIVMTIYEDEERGRQFSFVLRVNEDKSAYIASVAPFGTAGAFPFSTAVFDYNAGKVAQVAGVISSQLVLPEEDVEEIAVPANMIRTIGIVLTLLLLLLLIFLMRRSKRAESVVHST